MSLFPWTSTLRAGTRENTFTLLGKAVELMARSATSPNSISMGSRATLAIGAQFAQLASAACFRIVGDNSTGTSLTFRRGADNAGGTASTLTTAMTGANNDVTLTAVLKGVVGDGISLELVDPSGNDQALAITVTGQAISVSLATGPAGAITTTATQLVAALTADEDASALVTAIVKAGDTGAGAVIALAETNLAGGADVAPTIAFASGARIDLPCVANASEWECRRTDSSGTPVTLPYLKYAVV